MEETPPKRYVIIHGHFYQPPRENPWTGRIDRQDSAAPYHDWNERITKECYQPNARSRRLDGFGRIMSLVNNYEHISFNFGPTLLSWLDKEHPVLHENIVAADRASAEMHGGRGNAIAQVYNHMIMPLANRRDQETQILWGVRDFQMRFGRDPEGIWLAETAINETTLEILISHGFRFIVLSPFQAERIRPLDKSSSWTDVSDGSIPCGRVYKCYGSKRQGKRNPDRSINIFFYDAPLSTDISFNHLLASGDLLAENLIGGFERGGGDLVTVATDGEIYGHHEPFGDMALAYLIARAAEEKGLVLTNFGTYLDDHAPSAEVQIKKGPDDEGTAWSCSHGVGRWKRDCGCNTGAPEGWDQKWRTPLRNALDLLRDGLSKIFEKESGSVLSDPWKVRDEYIEVFAAPDLDRTKEFIDKHSKVELTEDDPPRIALLLESQRNAMYMYTSCGWFFNDISGIEPVQLLKYAARAVELARSAVAGDESGSSDALALLEKDFLAILDKAGSNIKDQGTGRDIYFGAKKYSSVEPSLLAGQYALASNLGCPAASPERFGLLFSDHRQTRIEPGPDSFIIGRFKMSDPLTLSDLEYQYLLLPDDPSRITCMLREFAGDEEYSSTMEEFRKTPADATRTDIIKSAAEKFGGRIFAMRDLFPEDKEQILGILAERQVGSAMGLFGDLYAANRELLRLFNETSLSPPESLLGPARTVLAARLRSEIANWDRSLDDTGLEGVHSVISEAKYYGVDIDRTEILELFEGFFLESLEKLREGLNADLSDRLHLFAEYAYGIDIDIPQHEIQNELFRIITTSMEEVITRIETGRGFSSDAASVRSFLRLARRFNFNTDSWQERLPKDPDDIV